MVGADKRRVIQNARAQPTRRGEQLERMSVAVVTPIAPHQGDDLAQGLACRPVSGQQRVCLAVESSDTHFEMRAIVVDHDTRDLETVHLTDKPSELDDGVGSGGGENVGERRDARVDGRRWFEGGGHCGCERRPVDAPHLRRGCEQCRAPSEKAGGAAVLDQDVDVIEAAGRLAGDGEGRAERARRLTFRQDPRAVDSRERGTAGERDGPPIRGTGGRVDKCGELGEDEPRPLLRIDRSYFLAPLRWP